MTIVDEVRRLAAEGVWQAQIADRLGISRQRVLQILREHNIQATPYHQTKRTWNHKQPVPRVITGGVMVPVSHSVAGTIAEFLVAADLMARGWYVFMPVMISRGHDIIAEKGDKLITIEVRSAYKNKSGQLRYNKNLDHRSQFYALVVTGDPVYYEPELPD